MRFLLLFVFFCSSFVKAEDIISKDLERLMSEKQGPYKVWVFFRDKGFTSKASEQRALEALEQTYNPRALKRRTLRSDLYLRTGKKMHTRDLPVSTRYILEVEKAGGTLARRSNWLNAISVWADKKAVRTMASLDCIQSIKPVARGRRKMPIPSEPSSSKPARSMDYGRSGTQLEQINLINLHDEGYTGEGVVIGVLDTGFKRTHEAFSLPGHEVEVLAEYDFVNNDANTAPEPGDDGAQHHHGTYILGCIGSYLPGEMIGGAPDASFILCKTEDTTGEYQAEEDNYVAGVEFAELNGADIITASLGYIDWYTQADLDGLTAVTTIAVNAAIDNGMHFCNAAGNEYHDSDPTTSSIIAPADAFKVITCGAVTSSGAITSFSSDGPTADGRLKPEILALGSSTITVSPFNDSNYTTVDGTSLSTPLIAAAVACLIQAHPEWTVDEMRDAIFHTASDYVANGEPDPLFVRGYGIMNAFGAIQDCNDNQIPDVIEIANGTETDCQGNSILDVCEILAGDEEDCNLNGLPDSCDLTPPSLLLQDDLPATQGWIEIASTGSPLDLGDDQEISVSIPFTNLIFPTGQAIVANNGGVGFSTGTDLSHSNESIPSESAFNGTQALLPFWDDLDSDTGNVFVETRGTEPNRNWIVQWDDRPHYNGDDVLNGNEITFQIQVYESPINNIWAQILYEDTDFQNPTNDFGASASVGYQKDETSGHQYAFNQAVITPSTILSLVFDDPPFSSDENGNGIPDECENVCLGDLNEDDIVDESDFLAALPMWKIDPKMDLNRDQTVDLRDYLLLRESFGPCE
ncbi:MAG: hypothetical protein CR997_00795 [Acidobacteria bacterium]|nr:MAG: hypothetical protein CR997_00795 [Acidobacteriota bacterium]